MPCLFGMWTCLLRNSNFFVFNIYYKVEEQRLVSCATPVHLGPAFSAALENGVLLLSHQGAPPPAPPQPQAWFLQIYGPAVTEAPRILDSGLPVPCCSGPQLSQCPGTSTWN